MAACKFCWAREATKNVLPYKFFVRCLPEDRGELLGYAPIRKRFGQWVAEPIPKSYEVRPDSIGARQPHLSER